MVSKCSLSPLFSLSVNVILIGSREPLAFLWSATFWWMYTVPRLHCYIPPFEFLTLNFSLVFSLIFFITWSYAPFFLPLLSPSQVPPSTSLDYFVPLLSRNKASTLWSSIFSIFIWSVSCIVGTLSFFPKRGILCFFSDALPLDWSKSMQSTHYVLKHPSL